VINGILFLIRSGAALCTVPPWSTAESYYWQWQADGTWHRITGAPQASSARPHPLPEQYGDLKTARGLAATKPSPDRRRPRADTCAPVGLGVERNLVPDSATGTAHAGAPLSGCRRRGVWVPS